MSVRTTWVISMALLGGICTGAALDTTGSTAPAPTTDVAREGCVTAECHPGVKSKPFLHGPMRVNGCDGCHRLADATDHRFELIRDRRELCALCHSPEPSDAGFVHAPFAQGECLTCHDPHGSAEPALLRGERYADACAACHQDVSGAHDRVHGPVSAGACGACHQPHASKFPKLLNEEGRDLCLRCHIRIDAEIQSHSVVHDPARGDCLVCHSPHATDHPAILREDPGVLCLSCHQDVADRVLSATTQHAAVTSNRECLNCHTAHASAHASLLRDQVQTLCFECHNQPIQMPDGTTLVNMKQVIESGKSLHGAVTQRGCTECHEMHGSDHRRLLTTEYPSELYYPFAESRYALCFSCHDRELVMAQTTTTSTGFRNGDRNLHFVHVHDDKRGRSCSVCHDAHAASREKHIRDSVPYGQGGWKLPIRFVPTPEGGSCAAGCHAAYSYDRINPVVNEKTKGEGAWKGDNLVPDAPGEPAPEPKKKPQSE